MVTDENPGNVEGQSTSTADSDGQNAIRGRVPSKVRIVRFAFDAVESYATLCR